MSTTLTHTPSTNLTPTNHTSIHGSALAASRALTPSSDFRSSSSSVGGDGASTPAAGKVQMGICLTESGEFGEGLGALDYAGGDGVEVEAAEEV